MNLLNDIFEAATGKDICIIGKGHSIDKIDQRVLQNCYVINVNDSHKAYQGHVSVMPKSFYDPASLPASIFIISSVKTDRPHSIFVEEFHEDTLDHYDLTSMLNGELRVYDASFVTALQLASAIIKKGSIKNKVFLLGFDFEFESGYARSSDIIPTDANHANIILRRHEKKFIDAQSFFKQQGIDVIHVGNKPYSLYNVDAFNAISLFKPALEGETWVFKNNGLSALRENSSIDDSFSIVAEITTNHFGDIDRLLSMILLAKKSGATHVKLQKRDVMNFYSSKQLSEAYNSPFGKTFKDYRHGLELSDQQFQIVDKFCSHIGIEWFASVLDIASYEDLKKFKLKKIKLPSTISGHKDLLSHVAKDYDGEVIISTGFTDKEYQEFVIDLFADCKALFLLQCTSAYPCALEDAHIGIVRHYDKLSTRYPYIKAGYSSHDIGAFGCQLAVAAGAVMVEKHVKMGSVEWAHFDDVALDLSTDEFANFVSQVNLARTAVKDEIKTIKPTEHHKYRKSSYR